MKKEIVVGLLLISAVDFCPRIASAADTNKESARIEKLEDRMRQLETRMATVEADSHKQMGMMQGQHGMGMGQGQHGPGMANQPTVMGQPPANPPMGGMPDNSMPQGGAAPSGNMPPMGDM